MPVEIESKVLTGGLILRRATLEDAQEVAAFNARIHSDEGPDKPDEKIAAWTLDLFSGQHPFFQPRDFTVVVDQTTGKIVSSLCHISQTWTYGGISFKVGRPELVGTAPEYRRKGLIREQFNVVHQWSQARGELVQVITGIPNYYRQFEYEMCVNLSGAHIGYQATLPKLADGEDEPYRFRPAQAADIPWIQNIYQDNCRRSLLAVKWTDDLWRHELFEKRRDNVNHITAAIIEDRGGEPVGFICYVPFLWGSTQVLNRYDLKPGSSYLDVTPSVLRFLAKTGQENAEFEKKECTAYGLYLGEDHPAYRVTRVSLPYVRKPYAYYVRVPDVLVFILRIASVLEQRLEDSVCAGYSGDLKLNLYNSGIQIHFTNGKITGCEQWPEPTEEKAQASFPGLTFFQVLFGYRSLSEVEHLFVDCVVDEVKGRPLLEVLFPRQNSEALAIC